MTREYKYRDLILQVLVLDAKLMTLLCEKDISAKSKKVKTGW
jgi:hypothetical protein